MKHSAAYWKEQLQLESHPEGGSFASSFAASSSIKTERGYRPLFSSIYFLLTAGEVSHFHQLESDELWYYHDGAALIVHMITVNGDYRAVKLGLNLENGERPQVLVSAGTIFGSSMNIDEEYSLVGCMVSPGFDFKDFQLFTEQYLLSLHPQHAVIIKLMTP